MTKHRFVSIIPLIVLLAAPFACGPSMDTEEASAQCDRIAADLLSCIDKAAHSECVACYEDCGRECSLVDSTCPHQFTCD